MDLILWRHAEAEDGSPDLERRLTPKGRKQAARVAEWLLQRLPAQFTVLASPALRAQETAEALGVPVRTVAALAPGTDVRAVLDAAGWPDRKRTVLVVGHQPALGCVAGFLVSGEAQAWSVRKGGLWWISLRERDDGRQAVVRAVVAPDFV
jgi:phosphohistidine phosphatase